MAGSHQVQPTVLLNQGFSDIKCSPISPSLFGHQGFLLRSRNSSTLKPFFELGTSKLVQNYGIDSDTVHGFWFGTGAMGFRYPSG